MTTMTMPATVLHTTDEDEEIATAVLLAWTAGLRTMAVVRPDADRQARAAEGFQRLLTGSLLKH